MQADDSSVEIRDDSEYEQKGYTIKDIILRHIKKVSDICCKEFTGGYWEKKPVKTSGGIMFTEQYHEDVREMYCNAIDFLVDIIYPISDKPLKEYIDKNDVDIEDVKAKLKSRRSMFKEINKMFDRTNFWQGSEEYNE
jgi:hypothetical protein